tara:strand:+ start:3725 stop:4669 length:945 start_codon:yes stop_codon:yes gene_type:complete
MFISSCPLRVSLFGGSTDNPVFVEKYGYGSVISFSCNLKTYITLHEDKLGYNQGGKYIINYSKREEVDNTSKIKNELIRIVFENFKTPPVNVSMTSDAYSQGSGLASSSSYIISLLKCLSMYYKTPMTDIEICEMAYELELKMNPYCGYQDPYGCGVGGFKRIEFKKGGVVKYNFMNADLFREFDAHLVFTGVTRNSKVVLKDVTANVEKIKPLLLTVDKAHDAFYKKDYDEFLNLMNDSWTQKKNTSSAILKNNWIRQIDDELFENKSVIAHKLCGAGNGGFFLTFSRKGDLNIPFDCVKINVETTGVSGRQL